MTTDDENLPSIVICKQYIELITSTCYIPRKTSRFHIIRLSPAQFVSITAEIVSFLSTNANAMTEFVFEAIEPCRDYCNQQTNIIGARMLPPHAGAITTRN